MRNALAGLVMMTWASAMFAAPPERWLHIRVDETSADGDRVRINLPLDLAEKILPAIKTRDLCAGKVKVDKLQFEGVDVRAVLDALRAAKDNEFVSIESNHEDVRVAKSAGQLVIKVREGKKPRAREGGKSSTHQVDVSIPFPVVDALLSENTQELDLLAAIRALSAYGDTNLVTVNDDTSRVRIWVDSQNASD